jgi:hypothetical protein
MTIQERLALLHNRLTCYEIVAVRGDTRLLVCYSQSRSRNGLLAACRKRGQALIDHLWITPSDMLVAAPRAADGFTIGPWSIRYSGRTERDAIQEGELSHFTEVAEPIGGAA